MDTPPYLDIPHLRSELCATGRGKHVGATCYFHIDVIRTLPRVLATLNAIRVRVPAASPTYNVVKLQAPSRISFLTYEDFASPFPVLAYSLALDVAANTARQTDYRNRNSPPILHRKELLLPEESPLAAGAAYLTARLEARGAFATPRRIGTARGWSRALADVGLALHRGQVVGW